MFYQSLCVQFTNKCFKGLSGKRKKIFFTHALLSSSQIILTLHLITQIKHAQHLLLTKVKLPTFIPGMKVMLLLGPLIIHTLRHIPSPHHDAHPSTSYQGHTYSQPNLSAQSGPGSPQQSSASAPTPTTGSV